MIQIKVYLRSRRKVLAIALTLVFLAGCGGTTIQSVLNGSGPLLNFLVKNGKITQPQADALKQDFKDAGTCSETLDNTLDQIPKEDPEAKKRKLNAWVDAGKCWKVIVLRQNFAADPRVQNTANIIEGIFAAGIVFYSESGAMRASAEGAVSAQKDDKVLDADLDKRLKELKAAMKP